MPAATPWSIDADFLQACNCEYGCPCEFEAPPSHGKCEGVGVWRINTGHYGGVKLDGLTFGFAASWPGALHLGGGTGGWVIDAAASPEQREVSGIKGDHGKRFAVHDVGDDRRH